MMVTMSNTKRVQELFERVVGLQPDERAAVLAEENDEANEVRAEVIG